MATFFNDFNSHKVERVPPYKQKNQRRTKLSSCPALIALSIIH